jgi:hypothetical protein
MIDVGKFGFSARRRSRAESAAQVNLSLGCAELRVMLHVRKYAACCWMTAGSGGGGGSLKARWPLTGPTATAATHGHRRIACLRHSVA